MANTTSLPRGRGSFLRLAPQADFKTPAAANFIELNTYTRAFKKQRPLEDDDVTGTVGFANPTDDRPAAPGLEDSNGTLSVPLDLVQIGYWLTGAFGAPTSAVLGGGAPAGSHTHTFSSGAVGLPIRSLEGQNATGQFEAMIGALISDITLPIGADKGYAEVAISLNGRQTTDPYDATIAGAPTVVALSKRVPKSSGVFAIGGANVGRITTGSLKVTNKWTLDRYAGDNLQSDAFLEAISAAIDVTARYKDDTLRAYGMTGGDGFLPDPVDVTLTWSLGDYLNLVVDIPAVRFNPVDIAINNGGLITQQLQGRAEVGAAAAMLSAVLTNQQADYT